MALANLATPEAAAGGDDWHFRLMQTNQTTQIRSYIELQLESYHQCLASTLFKFVLLLSEEIRALDHVVHKLVLRKTNAAPVRHVNAVHDFTVLP